MMTAQEAQMMDTSKFLQELTLHELFAKMGEMGEKMSLEKVLSNHEMHQPWKPSNFNRKHTRNMHNSSTGQQILGSQRKD